MGMDLIRHRQAAGVPVLAGPGAAAVTAARRGGEGGISAGGGRGARVARSRPARGEAAGEAAAVRPDLDEVFRRDYQVVVGVAARVLGDRDQAEDVAQEVFLSFSGCSVPGARARGWLCVAAAHTALNTIRSHRRRTGREEAAATAEHATVPDVADAVVRRDEHRRVRAALAQLPRTQAVALVLRHSGLSYADVAAALDLSPTSIGTTVRRAESALRKELNRHGSHV
ncbi:RNA polymerase, sigma-24 subunit, ECF subfamily [Parafrankia sp. EUN1f]|nr:RNA polymerase, sigma-24 subunit, ECF subfamily [Parafrankia sp. EUN1f]